MPCNSFLSQCSASSVPPLLSLTCRLRQSLRYSIHSVSKYPDASDNFPSQGLFLSSPHYLLPSLLRARLRPPAPRNFTIAPFLYGVDCHAPFDARPLLSDAFNVLVSGGTNLDLDFQKIRAFWEDRAKHTTFYLDRN